MYTGNPAAGLTLLTSTLVDHIHEENNATCWKTMVGQFTASSLFEVSQCIEILVDSLNTNTHSNVYGGCSFSDVPAHYVV